MYLIEQKQCFLNSVWDNMPVTDVILHCGESVSYMLLRWFIHDYCNLRAEEDGLRQVLAKLIKI